VANFRFVETFTNVSDWKLPTVSDPFVPYHCSAINEYIATRAEDDLLRQIHAMDYTSLRQLNNEIQYNRSINPSYTRTKDFRISYIAGKRRLIDLDKAGLVFERMSPLDVAFEIMVGTIIGDEFSKRVGGGK
jgi:hypothetical protein